MRRMDREIKEIQKIEEILKKSQILHLGLLDKDYPYVIALHYGYSLEEEKLTLYMHGAKEGKKYDLIQENPNAFIEIDCDVEMLSGGEVACKYGSTYASIMGRGKVSIVEEIEEKCRGLELLMETQTGKHFPISEEMANTVYVIKVEVESFTAKARTMPKK